MVAQAGELRMGTPAGRWVLLTTVLGSGIVMIDGTVVNVALERIGHRARRGLRRPAVDRERLHADAGLADPARRLAGRSPGRRRVFLIGVVWFAVASLACGLAPNIELLIAARALQGVGGALLTPGSLALISASFHGPDRSAARSGPGPAWAGSPARIGPFLGGWLVEWSWRAVFLINLPLAAVIVVDRAAARAGEPRRRIRRRVWTSPAPCWPRSGWAP